MSGGKLAAANACSKNTGKNVGDAKQGCPKKPTDLSVKLESATKEKLPKGNITVKLLGTIFGKAFGTSKKAAQFKDLTAGTYNAAALITGWAGGKSPEFKLAEGEKKSITLKLEKLIIQKVEPFDGKKPIKWFINQDLDVKKSKGRKVPIKVTLSKKIGGVEVHFTIEAGKKNNKSLSPESLKASLSAQSVYTDVDGVAETTLTLSQYGGDEIRVNASLEPKKTSKDKYSKQSHWFKTWSRIFYQIDAMKRAGGGSYMDICKPAKFEKEYARHYVEMNEVKGKEREHKRTSLFLNVEDWEAYTSPMREVPKDDPKRYVHILMVDTVARKTAIPITETMDLTGFGTKQSHGSPAVDFTFDPDNAVRSIEVEITRGENKIPWAAIPTTHIQYSFTSIVGARQGWHSCEIDLSSLADIVDEKDNNLFDPTITKIRLRYTWCYHDVLCGFSWGASIAVGVRYVEAEFNSKKGTQKSLVSTLVHEVGHNFGLAPAYKSDGTKRADPASWYYKAGAHCHEGNDGCTMYESDKQKLKFCPVCADGLRARDLSKLNVIGSHAN